MNYGLKTPTRLGTTTLALALLASPAFAVQFCYNTGWTTPTSKCIDVTQPMYVYTEPCGTNTAPDPSGATTVQLYLGTDGAGQQELMANGTFLGNPIYQNGHVEYLPIGYPYLYTQTPGAVGCRDPLTGDGNSQLPFIGNSQPPAILR
jgi:hypothetical protein